MRLLLTLVLLLLGTTSFSQELILPVDESGKYIFLEITELKLVPKSIMAANAKRFFKANPKSMKLSSNEKDSIFLANGKMIVQKGVGAIGHPSAEVSYSLSLGLREGRYRLILTDFIMTPYERDRYGNFVPVTVSTPMERPPGKLGRADWDKNMAFVFNESRKIADKLKAMMVNTQAEPKQEAKKPAAVSTKEW